MFLGHCQHPCLNMPQAEALPVASTRLDSSIAFSYPPLLFQSFLSFTLALLVLFRLVVPHLSDSTPSRLVVSYSEYTRFIVPFRSDTAHFLLFVLFFLSFFLSHFFFFCRDALHFFHPPIIADLSPFLASLVGYHILNSPLHLVNHCGAESLRLSTTVSKTAAQFLSLSPFPSSLLHATVCSQLSRPSFFREPILCAPFLSVTDSKRFFSFSRLF